MTDLTSLQDISADGDFNIGTAAILVGLGAEDYIEAFKKLVDCLEPADVAVMLKESSKLLNRIKLSLQANKVALTKTKNISDCLLLVDKYASTIVIETLSKLNTILSHIDQTITNNVKVKNFPRNPKKKKWLVGLVGSSFVTLLTICFVKSLKSQN